MANDLLTALHAPLSDRAGSICELCGDTTELAPVEVGPSDLPQVDRAVLACASCQAGIEAETLEGPHWFCLQESAWSEVPAVQVLSYRLLHRSSEGWASELIEQIYMEEDVLDWARQEIADPNQAKTVDSNGTQLSNGDSVTLIKDLDVKGANFTAKRGTLVRGIRLNEDPGLVEGRVKGTAIFLKTEFLKKA
ncbi:MAG: PhnA domain-containing protein [Proteobacteria bacterium]|nr:PhnA domain-containing protein [Pseudomonadota bacterium]